MTFWGWFFLFLIYIPLLMLWAMCLVDVFQRQDLSGGTKALWVIAFFVFPWLGLIVYMFSRPPGVPGAMAQRPVEAQAYTPMTASMSQDLERLAKLRSEGAITEAEFATAKAKILGTTYPETKAA